MSVQQSVSLDGAAATEIGAAQDFGALRPSGVISGTARLGLRLGLRRFIGAALDLVYPPACMSCRAATGSHGALCPRCWSEIRLIEKPVCDRLGTPFAYDLGIPGLLSPAAMAHPPAYARARAVARFEDGPARQLVHRLKYQDRMELADAMGSWMARAGHELLADADCLIPVPLHRRRLLWRQFNQAQALAVAIGCCSGKPVEAFLLKRVKRTKPQIGLTRAQRADNVQGAFAVADAAKPLLAGCRVLLIDDVLTTGATINAAARALLRGGAARVDVLVFARVVTGS